MTGSRISRFVLIAVGAAGLVTAPAHALPQLAPLVAEAEAGSFPLAAADGAAPWYLSADEDPGVLRAARALQTDIAAVVGAKPELHTDAPPTGAAVVIVGVVGRSPLIDALVAGGAFRPAGLAGRWESFVIETVDDPLPGVEGRSSSRGAKSGGRSSACTNWPPSSESRRGIGGPTCPRRHARGSTSGAAGMRAARPRSSTAACSSTTRPPRSPAGPRKNSAAATPNSTRMFST